MELGGKATNRTSSKALATVSSNSIDLPVGSDPIIGTSRLWERRKLGNGIVARGCRAIGIDSCFTDRMIKVIGGKTGSALIESFSDATFENGKIFGAMEKKKKVLQFSYFTQAQRQILVHLGDPMKYFSLPFLVSRADWKRENITYAVQ